MFDPSREQARHFFLESWRKARAGEPLMPMEQLAAAIIAEHPEYHATLSQAGVLERDFVLVPLLDIDANLQLNGNTLKDLDIVKQSTLTVFDRTNWANI